MIWLTIIGFAFFLWFFVLKPYFKPHDTVELWVGTNGSGKTLNAVKSALHCLKRNRRKIFWYNIFHPFKRKSMPVLISNIPIKRFGKIISYELKAEHLLGIEKLPEKCVVLIDEVSLWLSQMEYNNKNITSCDWFATLYRHFTLGGFLILTTQDINKCAFPYRYVTGSAFVLSDFKKHWWALGQIGSSSVRRISINGDIQAIEVNQKEDNEDRIYCSLLFSHYDTYAYSNMYNNVPSSELVPHDKLKVDKVLKCPKEKQDSFIKLD